MSKGARVGGREATGKQPDAGRRSRRQWICGLAIACSLGVSANANAGGNLDYSDVQLCANTYNQFWWSFESIKSSMRNADPAQVAAVLRVEFAKVLVPGFHFDLFKLPLPPDYTTTTDLSIDGIDDLADVGAYGITHFGEHHVAGPFSVKLATSSGPSKTYMMTTRDLSYTRDGTAEGGCTVYLAQKDVMCKVQNPKGGGNDRTALLTRLVNNVVTAYKIPAPQCALWIEAPVTRY